MNFEDDDRFITSTKNIDETEVENTLRPGSMAEYVGQDKIKENLEVYIQAAKKRGAAFSARRGKAARESAAEERGEGENFRVFSRVAHRKPHCGAHRRKQNKRKHGGKKPAQGA